MKALILVILLIPGMSFSQHFISESDTTDLLAKYRTKNFSITDPVEGDNLFGHIWEVGRKFTILKVVTVLQRISSTSPDVDWTMRHGTDRSGSGTELVTGGSTTNSLTTGNVVTTFNDATIDENEFIWVTISETAGVVDAIHYTVYYKMGQ